MTRTFIGIDSTGAGAIKIMQNDLDDPRTTPDSQVAKFRFNSKWAAQIRYEGYATASLLGGAGNEQFIPSGSDESNFQQYSTQFTSESQDNFFRNSYFPNLDYTMPAYDVQWFSGGTVVNGKVNVSYSGWESRAGRYRSSGAYVTGWLESASISGYGFSMSHGAAISMSQSTPSQSFRLLTWNLPADSQSLINQGGTPVPGQMQVQITEDFCRVSKPGYDVRTASRSQKAFDSSSRPAKVVAAADINVPSGNSSYTISTLRGITVSGNLIADVIFYQGSTVYFPTNPLSTETEYGANYSFSGTTINFSNPYGACRARFVVYAQDDGSATSGSNKVFRQFNDGVEDVVQFLRPGAAATPRLADILIDSRWPCLQIIRQGYIGIGGGAQENAVSFTSAGLFPFIKYWTVHSGGDIGLGSSTASKLVRVPFTNFGYIDPPSSGKQYYTGGDSSYCRLTTNEARFYTFVGNPIRRYLKEKDTSPGYTIEEEYSDVPIIGIRYYIFGIPV